MILDVLLQLAKESDLSPHKQLILENKLRWAYDLFDGLGFCLSAKEDLLSQWRGYADDGRGVCIGFNKEYLRKIAATRRATDKKSFVIKEIVYDEVGQRKIAATYFEEIKALLDQGAFHPPNRLAGQQASEGISEEGVISLFVAMSQMFDIKNPAFSEEQEWRLISLSPKAWNDDEGDLEFRANGDKVVPYLEVELEKLDATEPIGRVMLGPKHQTPRHAIERMLARYGFGEVEISKSSATYR